MAATVMNIAKGRIAHYGSLPLTNDALIAIPLMTTGIEADATMQDYDTVALLLAASSDEQTTLGRKTLTGVTVTVDDTNNRVDIDVADPTWTAGGGVATSRLLFAYDPDTTTGTDADLVPLGFDDFVVTPAGGDITYVAAATGPLRAS